MSFIHNSKTYNFIRDKKTFYLKTIAYSDTSQTITITTNGQYILELIGGGGGGACQVADNGSGSAGGGAGGYLKVLYNFSINDSLVFSLGSGGSGLDTSSYGRVNANSGTASTLTINSTLSLTCNGGSGGSAYYSQNYGYGGTTSINDNTKIEEIVDRQTKDGATNYGGAYSHPPVPRTLSPMTLSFDGYGSGGGITGTSATAGGNGAFRLIGIYDYPISGYESSYDKYNLCSLIYNSKSY